MSGTLTAIILTFNEEQHIERCIESLEGIADRVCVVDSFSKDKTVEIARSLGADVFQNPWKNYATQFNWALKNCQITDDWTLRIDADEVLDAELRGNMRSYLNDPSVGVNAVYLKRKMIFLQQPITHGFFYPAKMLRLWRTGEGRVEQRWMDEHVLVENAVTTLLDGDLIDENLNDLSWWIEKHNGYATREVYDIVESRETRRLDKSEHLGGQARLKRFLKENVYANLPTSIRGSFYFFYRYVLGRGFLDGKSGFFFHFLQAFWYRTLVDAKLTELEQAAEKENLSPYDLLSRDGIYEE